MHLDEVVTSPRGAPRVLRVRGVAAAVADVQVGVAAHGLHPDAQHEPRLDVDAVVGVGVLVHAGREPPPRHELLDAGVARLGLR